MKRLWILFVPVAFLLWWSIASDYGDGVVSGAYHLAQNGETSTLILGPDHSFHQELTEQGKSKHATGTWRSIGERHIAFSKEFLILAGQEPGADGTPYGEIHKHFGVFVFLTLSQYHVLWYGRVDPSPTDSVSGTYIGDEPGVSATLILEPNHTFEQSINTLGVTKQAKGNWSISQNGGIVFSKDFLKTSGEALRSDETASHDGHLQGPNLQIQITKTSSSGVPTFRKKQLF
jgi:hypothetical protein